jgi:hypothetical protein
MRFKCNFCTSAVLFVTLSGCGGSSGTNETLTGVLPKVTITWPDLSRKFEASKFAKSARIVIEPAAPGGTISTWIVDRPTGTAGVVKTYSGTDVKVTGPVAIQVQFFSGTGVTGNMVASAAISGRISVDGTLRNSEGNLLGSIASEGLIVGILATGNHPNTGEILTTTNSSQSVVLNGVGPSNSVIALDQTQLASRVSSAIITGSTYARTNGLTVTGLSEGMAMVRFTLDGMSADVRAWTGPPVVPVRTLDLQASAIAYDQSRQQFWAAIANSGPNANSLVLVNPTTGAIGNRIEIGGEANLVAVSKNGQRAYVGIPEIGGIKYISLSNSSVVSTMQLDQEGPGEATSIDVNPDTPTEAAVTVKGTGSSSNWGPLIVRDGTVLPDYLIGPYSRMSRVAYLDGSNLVGASGETSDFPVAQASVGPSGCVLARSQNGVLPGYGLSRLAVKNGSVLTSSGFVFDSASLNPTAQLDYLDENTSIGASSRASFVATDSTNQLVWLLFAPQFGSTWRLRSVRTNNWTLGSAVTIEGLQGNPKGLYRFGTRSIAIHTDQAIYTIDNAPGL